MSNITSQSRIARQLDGAAVVMTSSVDYPQQWSCTGNATLKLSANLGNNHAYFPDITSKVIVINTMGMFNLSPLGEYEAECFVSVSSNTSGNTCSLMDFGGLSLNLTDDGKLQLASEVWNIEKTSSTAPTADAWHHVLLRIRDGTIEVYADGTLALSECINSMSSLNTESVTFGGYVGYMDGFAFRRNAGTGAPTVPTALYETETSTIVRVPTVNAPVTRAVWSAEDLPDGLSLSESGVLTGHPTTAGSYESTVTVTTNWGIASKAIRIVVE